MAGRTTPPAARCRNRRRGSFMACPPNSSRSICFDAGKLDHLAPLFGLFCNESPEFVRRAAKHRRALIGKSCFEVGIRQRSVDLAIEFADDFGGRVPRNADAEPRACLEARH